MSHPIEASIIRILKSGDSIAGIGFCVSERLAVTCAHVVKAAGAKAGGHILVRLSDGKEITAFVEPELWRDDTNAEDTAFVEPGLWHDDTNAEDIAFLSWNEPLENMPPVLLGSSSGTRGHSFSTFGFPGSTLEIITGQGKIVGEGYPYGKKLLQLESSQVTPGYSGGPIFDEVTERVVGMVVNITRPDEFLRQRTTAFAIRAETLWQVCSEIRPSDTCPYPGLDMFTETTARYFFGREILTEKLLDVLERGSPILALFGPSGSGKSSVVRAGLLPGLKKARLRGSQKWVQITMRPADDPFEQLKAAGLDGMDFKEYLHAHPDVERVVLLIDQFEELFTLCPDALRDLFVRDLATALDNSRLTLVLCMRDEFYSAFYAKAALLADPKKVEIVQVPGMLELHELVAMVERPAKTERLVLEHGLTDRIMADLTHDGKAPSSMLPLLEFALRQLWERRLDGMLTSDSYEEIKGVTGILGRWADDSYSDLPKEGQARAESLLLALVHPGDEAEGLPDTRRRRALAEFDEPTRRVIQHFADVRLLVTSSETVELVHDALVREWGTLQRWLKTDRENLRLREGVFEAAKEWETGAREENLLTHRGDRLNLALAMSQKPHYSLTSTERAYLDACLRKKNREKKFFWAGIGLLIVFAIFAGIQWIRADKNSQDAQTKTNELINLTNVDRANNLLKEHNPDLALALAMYTSQEARPAEKAYTTLLDAAYLSFSRDVYPLCQKDNTDIAWASNVDISPDNQWAAVGCFWKKEEEERSEIYRVDLKTGEPKKINEYRARIFSLAISPNGRQILAGYGDGSVILIDTTSSREATLDGHSSAVSAVAFNLRGTQAVTVSYDKTIKFWDIENKEIISSFGGTLEKGPFNAKFTSIDYSPDETKIVLGDDLGNMTVWDLEQNLMYSTPSGEKHSGFVMSVKFAPDSLKVYSGSADSTIAIWDIDHTNRRLSSLKAPGYRAGTWINSLALLPDGDHLLSAMSDGSILLWDLPTMQVIQHFDGHLDEVVSLDVSSDGTFAISGARDGSIRVWNLSARETIGTISLPKDTLSSQPPHTTEITNVALLNNDDRVIVGDSKGYIHLADTSDSDFVDGWQVYSDESPVTSLAVGFDESQILTGSGNGQVVLWDLDSHIARWSTNQKKGGVRSIDTSPDGKTALVGYENGEIILLNIKDGQTQCELSGHTNMVNSALFSPDGKYAVSGSNDHTVIWWDLENCKKSKILYQHDSWVMNLDFSPDGKQLASVSADGSAILWDIELKRQIHRLRFPDGDLNPGLDTFMLSVKFSPDGRLLATSSANGIVGLWSVANGTLLRKFIQPLSSSCTLATHCFWIWDVQFSHQADQLWSGSADGTVHSWPLINVKNTEELRSWIEKNRYLRQLSSQEKEDYDISQ